MPQRDYGTAYGRPSHRTLLKYGLIPEFVGSVFPFWASLMNWMKQPSMDILTRPRNAILKQYARSSSSIEGVKVTFTPEAAQAVAHEALQRKVGARGLRMILEELMLDLMYTIPTNKKVKELEITADMVKKRNVTLPVPLEKAG